MFSGSLFSNWQSWAFWQGELAVSAPVAWDGLGEGEKKWSLVAKMEQRGNRPRFSRLWVACG